MQRCLARAAILTAFFVLGCGAPDLTAPFTDVGSLEFAIMGLPSGGHAAIAVSGNGTSHTVNNSSTISLAPGTYTVTASAVQTGGSTWYPNVGSQTVAVGLGQTRGVTIRFGRLPVSGAFVADLDLFDSAMVAYMTARGIGAGTLAISSHGQVIYRRAFGWRDSAHTSLLSPNAMMRLASNSKPVTAAAIRRLISQGLLTLDYKPFASLGLAPAGNVVDTRIYNITVQHLLDHTGGWNRNVAGDIMFKSREISQALDIATPPTKTQFAQWAMTQPLQHAPGIATSYSNFGYLVLGLVVEKITGQSFPDYVKESIFTGSAVDEIIAGRSLRADRDPREPFYSDPYKGCSVFFVETCVLVPWPDGGWHMEAFDSCGGLVGSAPAMATFLEAYWINGQPRVPGTQASFIFFGSLDGTFTLMRQRTDGSNFVALFNQRTDPSGLVYDDIRATLDGVADRLFPAASVAGRF